VVAVPAPPHDVFVGNAEEEQSEQTAAAAAPEAESPKGKKRNEDERSRDIAPGIVAEGRRLR
jgi:hypothetical protein